MGKKYQYRGKKKKYNNQTLYDDKPAVKIEMWWLLYIIPLFRVKQILTYDSMTREYRLFGFIPVFSTETIF